MKKILITSFGTFGGFQINPSELVMNLLKEDVYLNSIYEITYINFEVRYDAVLKFYREFDLSFDLIIHLGVASHADKLRLEYIAKNNVQGEDVAGVVKKNELLLPYQQDLTSTLHLATFEKIRKNFPDEVIISKDAGAYLCNYLYYFSLTKAMSEKIIFIHIADFHNNPNAVSMKRQYEILALSIDFLLRDLSDQYESKDVV